MENHKYLGTVISTLGISLSVTDIQETVSIICTLIGLCITLGTTVIIPIIDKIKEKKSGKHK